MDDGEIWTLRNKDIRFCKLETPAKYYDETKQKQWIDTIVKQTTCMRA
jgi:hypothetical protein